MGVISRLRIRQLHMLNIHTEHFSTQHSLYIILPTFERKSVIIHITDGDMRFSLVWLACG